MNKPDSQQRGLAGEYYVAFILTRLGYDIGITIGRAKVFDMTAISPTGKAINIQVKCTFSGYDWLVAHEFNDNEESILALVRLGKQADQRPELYFVPGKEANKMITHKYEKHSPRIGRTDIMRRFKDHDFSLIKRLLKN